MSILTRAPLVSLVVALSSIGTASAQIVPETSGKTSAANSPAAAVQTGFRRRLNCVGCSPAPSDRGESRTRSSRDPFGREDASGFR